MFWENSPIKMILSQSIYKDFAWDYAFSGEDWEWDGNMENLDYSGIESKVYRFMAQFNKNPDIDFYFTPSSIQIFTSNHDDTTYHIDMADFYENIAIYTKYKAEDLSYDDINFTCPFFVPFA